jgi:hypothetical protein
VLRRIFGPKMEEVTGGWRKLHNEKFHNLHIKSRVRLGQVAYLGKMRNAYKILVRRLEGKRPLRRPRCR